MEKELIIELFQRFENARYNYEGIECWSARSLQGLFNYSQWRNFVNVIYKARKACTNAGENPADHFADVSKMIRIAKGAERSVDDVALTRYGCYLIAQNGDPNKSD